jgi:NADH-quinone oxidoreductase subunit K
VITLSHYLVLGAILFSISIAGIFLNRKNIIIILMSIELMLLAVNINFVAFSHYLGDLSGPSFCLFYIDGGGSGGSNWPCDFGGFIQES